MKTRGWFRALALCFGFAFLYVPILLDDRLLVQQLAAGDGLGSGQFADLKWYRLLLGNEQILGAAWLSIQIAAMTATGAVVLGTLAGLALARFGRFPGRGLLSGMTTAPLVMPEVITGLSMLLLFVALEQLTGWPQGRGVLTITIAHITFAMAYVTVVVQSRLAGFDDSLEEAALDLGARPAKVFFRITLPLILPADRVRLAARVHAVLG